MLVMSNVYLASIRNYLRVYLKIFWVWIQKRRPFCVAADTLNNEIYFMYFGILNYNMLIHQYSPPAAHYFR